MGVTRSDIYSEELNELADMAKVLGHPARIAILQHVARQEGCVCGSIVKSIGLAQATISQHLKELKRVGLIKGKISGTAVCYCIDAPQIRKCMGMIQDYFSKDILSNCCK
ncbi:MAG: metalloregulator ArsR/SmtB family transcription factor [Bacteroidota bacterium]